MAHKTSRSSPMFKTSRTIGARPAIAAYGIDDTPSAAAAKVKAVMKAPQSKTP